MITSFFSVKSSKSSAGSTNERRNPRRSPPSAASRSPNGDGDGDADDDAARGAKKRPRLAAAAAADPTNADTLDPTVPSPPSSSFPSADEISESDELLRFLDCDGDAGGADTSVTWRASLEKHINGQKFDALAKFVAKERTHKTVYPPPCDTFSALNLTPLHKVKIVIVGQDPYHGPGQGHGLAFSVRRGVAIPPSLRNMYKELLNDPAVPEFRTMPKHGYLTRWAEQGVLMINAVLTVRKGEANSHKKKAGWEGFTDEIIRAVSRVAGDGGGAVFLLWGKPASVKATAALGAGGGKHAVIQCSHPSPLGATKTASPFMGSRCFSRANEELVKRGLDPIDWGVEGALPSATKGRAAKVEGEAGPKDNVSASVTLESSVEDHDV